MEARPDAQPSTFAERLEHEVTARDSFRNEATWVARRVRDWLAQDDTDEAWEVDWNDQPSRYRNHEGARRFALDAFAPLRFSGDLRDPRAVYAGTPDGFTRFSHLLLLVAGALSLRAVGRPGEAVVDIAERFLRAVPSGGALFPWELYVCWRGGGPLPRGLYYYHPAHHALELLSQEQIGPASNEGDAVLVVTTTYWKNHFKYRDYSLHLQNLDAGVLIGQLAYLAPAFQFRSRTQQEFRDAPLHELLNLSPDESAVHAVIALWDEAAEPTARVATNPDSAPFPRVIERSRRVLPAHLSRLMNRASALTEIPTERKRASASIWPGDRANAITLVPDMQPEMRPLALVLRERKTGVAAFSSRTLEQGALQALLAFASLAPDNDIGGAEGVSSCISLFVAVNRVRGIASGVYRYEPSSAALFPVTARPIQDQTAELQRLYRLQNLSFLSVAAVVFVAGDHERALTLFGNRGLRYLDHAAGWALQHCSIGAGALNLGFHPYFGVRKRAAAAFLGLSSEECTPLIAMAIGAPPVSGLSVPLWL